MKILGVDPGLAHVGAAVVDVGGARPVVVCTRPLRTTPSLPEDARWRSIALDLVEMIRDYHPTAVGVEAQRGAWLGRARRGETNSDALATIECVGLVRGIAAIYDLPVLMVEPSTVKIAVLGRGGGRAGKDAVIAAVRRLFVGCPTACTSHQADAMAIALAVGRRLRRAR